MLQPSLFSCVFQVALKAHSQEVYVYQHMIYVQQKVSIPRGLWRLISTTLGSFFLRKDSQQCLFVTGANLVLKKSACSAIQKKKTNSSTNKSNLKKEHKGEMVLRFLSLICDKHKLTFSALTFKLLLPWGDLNEASARG
jgi:hypothetical protein